MNEKIKEFALQAGIVYEKRPELDVWIAFNIELEKFAELIVRECVGITDDLVNRNVDGSWTSNELYTDYNGALFEVKRRIQEHFGVEE
jgi:hypothetical protein